MEFSDLRTRLADDYDRLAAAAASAGLTAPVPSCPGWTVEDLVRHVAEVYLHKVECMRLGQQPVDWPRDFSGEEALGLLDRAYRELAAEFGSREPEEVRYTWFKPDQSVGFWIRRMAHETVVHRLDAERAAGQVSPVPADLALDGVDEMLKVFLEGWTTMWPEDFPLADGPAITVHSGGRSWTVQPGTERVVVTDGAEVAAGTRISAEPEQLMLWLWARAGDDTVKVEGDPAGVAHLRELLAVTTQ
ncbi:maleylpyruvate isomerase family mycothiol-dependent enzyme [Longispora albida]|uniref:maleylpyruvate isomerase family mycothiol-dependent enzyme n=1 Tax=Longispora albida TaxID=203523 RepID=UPI00035E9CE9|nr:maleylpyruvate isomerase family mycothiol-dependent enzyme [Longispora albida]